MVKKREIAPKFQEELKEILTIEREEEKEIVPIIYNEYKNNVQFKIGIPTKFARKINLKKNTHNAKIILIKYPKENKIRIEIIEKNE